MVTAAIPRLLVERVIVRFVPVLDRERFALLSRLVLFDVAETINCSGALSASEMVKGIEIGVQTSVL